MSVALTLGLAAIAIAAVLFPVVKGRAPAIDPPPPGSADPVTSPGPSGRRGRRVLPVAAIAIASAAAVGVFAAGAIAARPANAPLTGSAPSAAPDPTTAALDQARVDFQAGRLQEAADGYLSVLRADPSNAEASARLGLILALSGRPRAGMQSIMHARQVDPSYSEAELLQAVVQLRVLHHPSAAIDTLSVYLRTATQPDLPAAHALLQAARASLH